MDPSIDSIIITIDDEPNINSAPSIDDPSHTMNNSGHYNSSMFNSVDPSLNISAI